MDPMEEIRETFFQECEELLEALESGLLSLSEGEGDDETINAMFRAVHSVKGGAGAFALDDLVRFAHKFETTLDEVRAGRLEATDDVVKIFLKSADLLTDLVVAARDGGESDNETADILIAELQGLVGEEAGEQDEPSTSGEQALTDEEANFSPAMISFDLGIGDDAEETSGTTYIVRFRPKPDLYVNGNETGLLFRALGELGEVQVSCDDSQLPTLDALDPEGSYLSWTIELTTESDLSDIQEIFEFAEGDCDLEIEPKLDLDLGELELPGGEEAEGDAGEIDAAALEDLSEPSVEEEEAPLEAKAEPVPAEAAGAPAASSEPVEEEKKESKKAQAAKAASGPKATVRVDLDRVDRLINLVGELVINQAMLAQSVMEAGVLPSSSAATGLDELKQLTREIQESVMAIRAQPVKSLFQRMSRIVREGADATGKTVRLKTEGEATEVDKTVIERLSDPLTHMIRNAVDHGLESSEDRVANGKPPEGVVRLSAAHRSGRVVIDVSDDGGGINRKRVKQIAIDKGLIPEDAKLTNGEIDNLLFMPGFSTAKEVSNLSGRGVGMDVVKRAIQALGGRITIASTPGEGTTFSISLPLTLAILDGMVLQVADQTVVVPLTSIVETLKPSAEDIHTLVESGNMVFVRGEFVPIIDVGADLAYREPLKDFRGCVFLLTEKDDGTRTALAVDAIQDQRQVVIKGLEDNYGSVPGVAAATILGDGRIALILDTDRLVSETAERAASIDPDFALVG